MLRRFFGRREQQRPARRSRRRRPGFTIIELGIVLAAMSVLAVVVVPDFIEIARDQLAQQAADHISNIVGFAQKYYHAEAISNSDPSMARWPGEAPGPLPGDPPRCLPASRTPLQDLQRTKLLEPGPPRNPWGHPVFLYLQDMSAGNVAGMDCRFVVTTDVPIKVPGVVKTYLAGARCNGGGGTPPCRVSTQMPVPSGFNRCCFAAQRPGIEAALANAMARQAASQAGGRKGWGGK